MRFMRDIVDRTLRDWLYPADDQPVRTKLTDAVSTTSTTIPYSAPYLAPEIAEMIGPGTIIEIDHEQVIVGDVDEEAAEFVDVIRGANGTLASTHTVDSEIIITPTWPRQTVFEALADSVVNLYPDLYVVRYEGPFTGPYIKLPKTAVEVFQVLQTSVYGSSQLDFRFSGYDPHYSSPSVYATCQQQQNIWVIARSKFDYPERESQSLEDIGILPEWERLIIVGALSYLIGREDFDPVSVESISEAIDQQGFPVRTGSAIRDSIIQYYEYLLSRARRTLLNTYSSSILQDRMV